MTEPKSRNFGNCKELTNLVAMSSSSAAVLKTQHAVISRCQKASGISCKRSSCAHKAPTGRHDFSCAVQPKRNQDPFMPTFLRPGGRRANSDGIRSG